jgi:hypothetical protein
MLSDGDKCDFKSEEKILFQLSKLMVKWNSITLLIKPFRNTYSTVHCYSMCPVTLEV